MAKGNILNVSHFIIHFKHHVVLESEGERKGSDGAEMQRGAVLAITE